MKKLNLTNLLLPLLAVTAHAQVHAQGWNVMQDFDDLTAGGTGTEWSYANAVSADGSVVAGGAIFGSSWMHHAFRWTIDGGMQDLGDLTVGGTGQSFVNAISADGSVIVGWASYSPIVSHAFRWTSAGGMQDLGDFYNGMGGSFASGVSADGRVVVGEATSSSGRKYRAFRWTSEGGMQDLGDLTATGTEWSTATAVSADGNVVVGQAAYDSSRYHAFRWTTGGGMQDLGDLTANGTGGSQAHAVSADGRVVVGRADYGSGAYVHAFRWTSEGGMQDLGDLTGSGTGWSSASAISADGSVVVGNAAYDSRRGHAFLWTSDGGMQGLGDLTADGTGWSQANAVSADGRTVVGTASNDQGENRAFIYRTKMQDTGNLQSSLPRLEADKELAAARQQMRMDHLLQTQCATGKAGVSCLKVTGSFDTVGADAGIGRRQQTQGVVTLGYGLSEQWTWGGNLLLGHASLRHSAVNPDSTYGLSSWLAYSQSGQAGNGWQLQASLGYSQQKNTITRGQALSNVELVSGSANLDALAARVALGFGVRHANGWLVTPEVALTQQHSKFAAYDEAHGDFLASYKKSSLKATVLALGVTAQKAVGSKTQLRLAAGVEQDLSVQRMKFAGTSDVPGAETFNLESALKRKALRPYVSAGYVYHLDAASAVAVDIGAERDAFSSEFNMGLSVSYSKFF
ncbi:autotransporter domain-containing protein [Comamonas sp. CMM02]|uniref:autotransporter domain-containing protein n=1 Tax=Comamonas sp. CMM02 TaxID=2769307 RepID=UPI001781A530|nr:autotransporter domain-containing protein [Comamonas sp. CMM02]MBD9400438.1 autotransporter domain-containing protein [Comamonas sp. CMM02]